MEIRAKTRNFFITHLGILWKILGVFSCGWAKQTEDEKERAIVMEAFRKADNTEQILRKRWGNTLKLIGKSNAEIKREVKKAS